MKTMLFLFYRSFVCFILVLFTYPAFSQFQKLITGTIEDQHSGERIPFASIRFRTSGIGKLSDSSGSFQFRLYGATTDSIEFTCVGYEDLTYFLNTSVIAGDTLLIKIKLVPGKAAAGVFVKTKANKGLQFWKRIVKHKAANDRYRFHTFSYELYNKLEFDIKNVKNLSKAGLLKPFQFVFDNIDTADGVTFLPAYLTEAISDYYYQSAPIRRREVFKAVKTVGIKNESFSKLLGGMDQNVNVYRNFIPIFDKSFISPISDNGDAYYKFKVADTQYVSGRRLIHFLFTPLRKGENTFEGDCWVHDTSYAIQKMNLRLDKSANINFLDRLSLIQEFSLINDSTWFLSRDKFVADISPAGTKNLSFICRKNTLYKNVRINDPLTDEELAKNRIMEETHLPESALQKQDQFWDSARHETLSKNEAAIYKAMDTLLRMPAFKTYTKTIEFLTTGCIDIGTLEFGPWYNWVSSNNVEGMRFRFDVSTNAAFSKNLVLSGYSAYGTEDKNWKGRIKGKYLVDRNPRMYIIASFQSDFDYGQEYLGELSSDNIFSVAFRKPGIPRKYIRLEERSLNVFKEWTSGFSLSVAGKRKAYETVRNLPAKQFFTTYNGNPFTSFELSAQLRFAYLEKFIENNFYRSSLGSPYPIIEAKYTKGFPGVGGSAYDYHKITASISNSGKLPPFGKVYFNLFGGKTYGTVPFMFLNVAPGNEIYYYNKYAFNMMNQYEFIHDQYVGFNVEHNVGIGLFKYIPLTRKMKWRQFWTAKGMWGSIREENKEMNFLNGYQFQSLDGKTYMEVGTGVDNILKVFRIDFIWRLNPSATTLPVKKFGVFGSINVGF